MLGGGGGARIDATDLPDASFVDSAALVPEHDVNHSVWHPWARFFLTL